MFLCILSKNTLVVDRLVRQTRGVAINAASNANTVPLLSGIDLLSSVSHFLCAKAFEAKLRGDCILSPSCSPGFSNGRIAQRVNLPNSRIYEKSVQATGSLTRGLNTLVLAQYT
jgi:hypothetical protein